jgi:hypothetical protein
MASVVHELVVRTRSGRERRLEYASSEAVRDGAVLALDGQWFLVDSVSEDVSGRPVVVARPARYRLVLRHPDGREESGAFRCFQAGSPRLGHAFTTVEDGRPLSWEIVDQRLEYDDDGEPCLALVAERDFTEIEDVPDHELEHALGRVELPAGATALLARAAQPGYASELVALEAGRLPDWEEARRYIDALTIEEIEDDLLEQCGVDPDTDPRERWLELVKERLRSDLELFRADVEGDHDEIQEWDAGTARVFASVGTWQDEADPDAGHGWLVRLVDASALGAAGFRRVRKVEL